MRFNFKPCDNFPSKPKRDDDNAAKPIALQDEGDWRCTALAPKETVEGGDGEETCCGLVVYVPKSYRVPTFLGRRTDSREQSSRNLHTIKAP